MDVIQHRHTCSRCATQFSLPSVPTAMERLTSSTPRGAPEDYLFATCPACGKKDWANERRFLRFFGPKSAYALMLLYLSIFIALVVVFGFFYKF